jgi:hypothetical protein
MARLLRSDGLARDAPGGVAAVGPAHGRVDMTGRSDSILSIVCPIGREVNTDPAPTVDAPRPFYGGERALRVPPVRPRESGLPGGSPLVALAGRSTHVEEGCGRVRFPDGFGSGGGPPLSRDASTCSTAPGTARTAVLGTSPGDGPGIPACSTAPPQALERRGRLRHEAEPVRDCAPLPAPAHEGQSFGP